MLQKKKKKEEGLNEKVVGFTFSKAEILQLSDTQRVLFLTPFLSFRCKEVKSIVFCSDICIHSVKKKKNTKYSNTETKEPVLDSSFVIQRESKLENNQILDIFLKYC